MRPLIHSGFLTRPSESPCLGHPPRKVLVLINFVVLLTCSLNPRLSSTHLSLPHSIRRLTTPPLSTFRPSFPFLSILGITCTPPSFSFERAIVCSHPPSASFPPPISKRVISHSNLTRPRLPVKKSPTHFHFPFLSTPSLFPFSPFCVFPNLMTSSKSCKGCARRIGCKACRWRIRCTPTPLWTLPSIQTCFTQQHPQKAYPRSPENSALRQLAFATSLPRLQPFPFHRPLARSPLAPLPSPSFHRPTDPSSLGQLKRPHPFAQGHLNAGLSTQPTTPNGPHLVCSARLVRAQFRLPTRPPAAFTISPSHPLTFVSLQKLSLIESKEVVRWYLLSSEGVGRAKREFGGGG